MTKESMDKLDLAIKKLEEDIQSGKFEEYFKDLMEKKKKRKEYVNSKEYFNWLEQFIIKLESVKRMYGTEMFLYIDKDQFTEQDIENEKYICEPIFDLFEEIGLAQGLEVKEDWSWSFPSYEWYFKFNNKMYFACKMVGQGTEYIVRSEKSDVKDYLDLDYYFSK